MANLLMGLQALCFVAWMVTILSDIWGLTRITSQNIEDTILILAPRLTIASSICFPIIVAGTCKYFQKKVITFVPLPYWCPSYYLHQHQLWRSSSLGYKCVLFLGSSATSTWWSLLETSMGPWDYRVGHFIDWWRQVDLCRGKSPWFSIEFQYWGENVTRWWFVEVL